MFALGLVGKRAMDPCWKDPSMIWHSLYTPCICIDGSFHYEFANDGLLQRYTIHEYRFAQSQA